MPKSSAAKSPTVLRVPALEIEQGAGQRLYSFCVDGKQLTSFAAISRVKRGEQSEVVGYQRPEVASHIAEIRRYLESDAPMIPNALVIAFDERVTFESGLKPCPTGRHGELIIPIYPSAGEDERPGWLVDGQQRAAAIREASVDRFPMFVTAFITNDEGRQRSQFILVNNTKPLPKGLINELLPATDGALPALLQRRRFPAMVLERLNYDEESPLYGRIKTATNGDGVIKDNSVLKMIENSLRDGALYRYWDTRTGGGDVDGMLRVLQDYWSVVADVFPEAWDLPPSRSRLVHGVGIVCCGLLMDAIADRYRDRGIPTQADFAEDLKAIAPYCRWTSGTWEFGAGAQRKWNELQNTSKDIQLLANHLLTLYKRVVWDRALLEARS